MEKMSSKDRINKGIRHFQDALDCRRARNEIESNNF